jgi:hypothetical protein
VLDWSIGIKKTTLRGNACNTHWRFKEDITVKRIAGRRVGCGLAINHMGGEGIHS